MRLLTKSGAALCVVIGVAVCYFDPLGSGATRGALGTVSDYSIHGVKRVIDLFRGQKDADYRVCYPNPNIQASSNDESSRCGERINAIVGENEKLKQMLNFLSDYSNLSYVTTRALVFYDGAKENVVLPVGLVDGVKEGHVVVNSAGLVGKIVEVWDRRSRVLLLTDKQFQMQVSVVDSGLRALVRGGDSGPVLLGAPQTDIRSGSLIVTSGGYEEKFPSGIYVGHVSGEKVITSLNPRKLDIVSVLIK